MTTLLPCRLHVALLSRLGAFVLTNTCDYGAILPALLLAISCLPCRIQLYDILTENFPYVLIQNASYLFFALYFSSPTYLPVYFSTIIITIYNICTCLPISPNKKKTVICLPSYMSLSRLVPQ